MNFLAPIQAKANDGSIQVSNKRQCKLNLAAEGTTLEVTCFIKN